MYSHGSLVTWRARIACPLFAGTGAALRAWLVDDLGLLPRSLDEAREAGAIAVRSTPTRRTVQSAQALVAGLYAAGGRAGQRLRATS